MQSKRVLWCTRKEFKDKPIVHEVQNSRACVRLLRRAATREHRYVLLVFSYEEKVFLHSRPKGGTSREMCSTSWLPKNRHVQDSLVKMSGQTTSHVSCFLLHLQAPERNSKTLEKKSHAEILPNAYQRATISRRLLPNSSGSPLD